MKSLATLFGLGLMLTFSSCFIGDDGPVGPQGPRGFDGVDGLDGLDGEEAFVFDFEGVSFTGPEYEVVIPYADDFVALDSDVTLVYFLWPEEGTEEDVWRALPQTIFTEDGLLQYNYNFTIFDVKLFLDANYSLDLLQAIDTDNWVVRIVVVPGQYWSGGRKEYPTYEQVKELYKLDDLPIYENNMERRK